MKKLAEKHGVSYQNFSTAIKLTSTLDNVKLNNSYLLVDYVVKGYINKYLESDTFLLNKLQIQCPQKHRQ